MSAANEVWCYLLTHTHTSIPALDQPFPVKCLGRIQELKEAVKNLQSDIFKDIHPTQLLVWRCPDSPILDDSGETIEHQVKRVIADKLSLQTLYPRQTLADLALVPGEVLIVQLPIPPTPFWCLALSHDNSPIGKLFMVFVDPMDNGAKLQEKAVQGRRATFKDIDPDDLTIWKLFKPRPLDARPLDEILGPDFFKKLRLVLTKSEVTNENENESAVMLNPWEKVGTPEHCPNDGLHFLVQVPQPRVVKRKADELVVDELELELKQRKRNQLATEPPSVIGRPSDYKRLQKGPDAILDEHPEPHLDIPPINLLYDGFGLFLDIFQQDTVEPEEINRFEMIKAVDAFARAMTRFYEIEDARREVGLPLLNTIFATRKKPLLYSDLRASAIGSVSTDGHCIGPHRVASMVVKFKNLSSGISSLPEPEIVSYFAHSQRTAIDLAMNPDLFLGRRIPCIGIVVIGWEIRFHALLTLGGRFRAVPLTPAISCVAAASNGWERKLLHRAFMAASVLHARIHTDCQSLLKFPQDTQLPYLPAISTLGMFRIKNLVPWFQSRESRYLYSAEDSSGREILVKFTPTYSEELHRFCHVKGHAPALLACEVLPGGWYGIAMEYLKDIDAISLSPFLGKYRHIWEGELRELVKSFHQSGLVHGDLRDANIVCNSEGELWLIDFDWGGKNGEVFYPTADLHEELISGRTSNSLAITASDDERVLEITLQKIKHSG